MRRWFHILFVLPLLLVTGCKDVLELEKPASGLVLTVCCEDPSLTKSTPEEGETRFNENLIKSVDFFFYPGETPDGDAKAVYHHREDLDEDPVKHTGDKWEATFTLVLPRVVAEQIFIAEKDFKATVYAVVNYNREPLTSTSSLSELADIAIETDFAATERDFIQNNFLMDGKTVITYNESASTSASGTINARRFAAKMTTAISVANQVNLKSADNQAEEIWVPVLHTMRIYLVDGAKNVTLGTESSENNTSPEYFTYSDQRRPFLKDNGETYLSTTPKNPELGEKVYYNTYPMYSYPVKWSNGKPDYTQPLPAQPYLKLEMDWRRKEENGYSYDRRKYYYKVILPTSSLERNNWYHFNIDVSILGSESDEDKAYLFPTTYYILDWQNKDVPIDKYAVISKARYLSVDTKIKTLNNLAKLSIPFLSSHDVKIVEGTVKARRPFYGVIKEGVAEQDKYSSTYHAWVRKNDDDESYYLDYYNQDPDLGGEEKYEPSNWLSNTSTTIEFSHELQNDYTKVDLDYSPYTIEFDIVHDDLTPGVSPYNEYVKHITIIQYPGIYIESCMNSDSEIRATSDNGGKPYYPKTEDKPWLHKPWGNVYIDGGRYIRTGDDKTEPYKKLSTDNNRAEMQWRTVWYTGGGRNIFRINVTVLPSNSEFVIGDPRIDGYDTTVPVLGYSFVNNSNKDSEKELLPDKTGHEYSNFSSARVVSGDVNTPLYLTEEKRPLKYYRPTEKSSRTKNMIAPAYRISTKLGGTEYGNIDEAHAKYRCAGYQEDGFPGGRWRIPTKSEIRFIAQLSAKGVFESMFSGDYWSANGVVNVNKGTGTVSDKPEATTALLRCVYDSWFWGDEQWDPRNEFVWGDREP